MSLQLYCVSFNDSYQGQTRIAQEWLQVNCPEFIRNDELSPNLPDPWTTLYAVQCWRPITSSIQNQNQSLNSKKRCR